MVTNLIGQIGLESVIEVAVERVRRYSLVQEFADIVRLEALRDVVSRIGQLIGESWRRRSVKCQDSQVVAKIEIGIDICRWIISHSLQFKLWSEIVLIWQFVVAGRYRGCET